MWTNIFTILLHNYLNVFTINPQLSTHISKPGFDREQITQALSFGAWFAPILVELKTSPNHHPHDSSCSHCRHWRMMGNDV